MIIRNGFCWILSALILLLAAGGLSYAAGAPAPSAGVLPSPADARPVDLYVLALNADLGRNTNPLPMEAALRAVAVELASRGVYVVYVPVDQLGALSPTAFPRLVMDIQRESTPVQWKAMFLASAKKSENLCQFALAFDSWRSLLSSTTAATDAMVAALAPRFKASAKPTSQLSDAELESLDRAFKLIYDGGPRQALPAAEMIDKVLTSCPSSAEALRAAAWPSAILATQDLYGHLQLRGRLLAVPLGWWIAAENASPGTDARAKLTAAWIALLCGFPNETLAMVGKIDKDGQSEPLAEALVMFATRDYRPLDDGLAKNAPAIKQLAWIWAIQECGLFESRDQLALEIMKSRECVAFGPMYGVPGVGTGHMFCAAMAGAATYDPLQAIIGMDAIPADARKALGDELASFYREADNQGECLWEGGRVARCVKVFNKGTALALKSADGPQRSKDGTLAWQCLSPWAYGQVQRGLTYQTLHLYAYFLWGMWGVPDKAEPVADDVVTAFMGDDSEAALFFQIVDNMTNGREAPGFLTQNICRSELASAPAQWALMTKWVAAQYIDGLRQYEHVYLHPCGAWEEELSWEGGEVSKVTGERKAAYEAVLVDDRYSRVRAYATKYEPASAAELKAIADLMPYNYHVAATIAWFTQQERRFDLAIDFYNLAIKAEPSVILAYRNLADVYAAKGDRARAIATLKDGCARSEYTVASGNAMSRLATILFEDGQKDESLVWAERGSETGSYIGLTTYGRILIDTGKVSEGLEYYRQNAERYDSGCWNYLNLAFIHKEPADKIIREARKLAKIHAGRNQESCITGALATHGQFDAARDILTSDVGIQDGPTRDRWLAAFALMEGKFQEADKLFRSAIDGGYLPKATNSEDLYTVQEAYIAACFAKDDDLKKRSAEYAARYENADGQFGVLARYMQGQITRDQAVEQTAQFPYMRVNLYWTFAAECEASGDTARALEYYKLGGAGTEGDWMFAGWAVRRRAEALEAKPGKTGQ